MSGFLSDDLLVDTGDAAQGEAQQNKDEKPAAVKAEDDEASEASHETQDEEEADEAEAKPGEDDEEAAQDDEDEDEQPEGVPTVVTVKIDGKDMEVPLEEAIRGYQRQADYSRKTQAHAQDVKAFEGVRTEFETERQTVAQERGQYKVLLGQLKTALDALAPQEPDWQALFAADKNEYLIQRDNWRAIQEQKQAVEAEAARVGETETQEQRKVLDTHIRKGMTQLAEWEPKWKDTAVRNADFQQVFKYAKDKLGFTDQDIANANDHRALYGIYKAMKYDELQAQAATVRTSAVKKGAKVLKAGSASSTPAAQQTRSKQDAMKRLVKGGGRAEDAAGLLENWLEL